MNAPKKIWVWGYAADQMVNENLDSTDVQYIRADLVDGLVEALEKISGFTMSQFVNTSDMANECRDVARAALKALEEA